MVQLSGRADEAIPASSVPLVVSRLAGALAPVPQEEPTADRRLLDDLAYHSLALAELAFAIEEIFGLEATDPAEVMQIETVGDVIEHVLATLDKGNGVLPNRRDVAEALTDYGVTLPLPDEAGA